MVKFFSLLLLPLLSLDGLAQMVEEIKITLTLKNVSLREAMLQIEKETPYRFMAKAEDIEGQQRVTMSVKNEPLNKVLRHLLYDRGLDYRQENENIFIRRLAGEAGRTLTSAPTPPKKKYSLHGMVRSERTGEALIGATVSSTTAAVAVATNEYGFYSMTLSQGTYFMQVSAVGMQPREFLVTLDRDLPFNIQLQEADNQLEVVTVATSPATRSHRSPQMSIERIHLQEIKNVPVIWGERDVLKTLQLLPGVKAAGEGSSGFYVRGGGSDQNLILLDEAPVYNASHLLGFFSTFNSDAIKNVTLYKGAMPAQYGGRLSSVVDIRMNEGNRKTLGVSGGIGLIASRLNVEGPIQKDRSSFLLSARRTYADVFLHLLGDSSLKQARLYFYDLNAKINFDLGTRDRLFLSGYFGRDVLSQEDLAGIQWGNATATMRWNHLFHKKLFSNTSFIFSNYNYTLHVNAEANRYGIHSYIRDYNLKEEVEWYPDSRSALTFGWNAIYHRITPGEISIGAGNNTVAHDLFDRYAIENAWYASHSWKPHSRWALTYGMRLTAFTILGSGDYYAVDTDGRVTDTMHYQRGEVVKTYWNPEPRFSASYQLGAKSALKISYTRTAQNLHLVSNSKSSSPTDKWVASTNIIRPEVADQVALGYYRNTGDSRYEFSVEGYYKTMQHQVDYRNGAQVFTNDAIESQLLFGEGRAYGVEWLLRKRTGRWSGWISYTLSKTERKIEGINNNQWYNARQDRTHDVAIVAKYQVDPKWTLSANWIYYTGDAVTYPTAKYGLDNEVYFYYSERNGYRLPSYHRLDLGATKQLKKGKRFSSELSFSIYNVYGRANAYQVSFRESNTDPNTTEAVKTALFTFVPSISYNFKF
jgi:hypothetical protein